MDIKIARFKYNNHINTPILQLNEDIMKKVKHADPMKTRTGKTRLGPLTLAQLREMKEKSAKPKMKQQIQNRINELESRLVK